jgi:antitoxin MazE
MSMEAIMILHVARWGNSLALRIPGAFAKETQLVESSAVDMTVEDGKLVVAPVAKAPAYDLDSLLSLISSENLPDERDFTQAAPVGREIW